MAAKKSGATSTATSDINERLNRAISEGRFQTALELAKQLAKSEPTDANRRRLAECYLGRASQFLGEGRMRDAITVLEVGHPFARDMPELIVKFAELFARAGDAARGMKLLESLPEPRPTSRLPALAADAALQRGAAARESLPETMRDDFDRIRRAFDQSAAGDDGAARETLQAIGLSSPFLEWKLLLRGLMAYYQKDDARAIENWSRLDPTRLPAKLAAMLRGGIDPAFLQVQPPTVQLAVRKQGERLAADPLLSGLRAVQAALVKARGNLMPAFREAETVIPRLRQEQPEMLARLARCFYWEIVERGQPEDRGRYERLFGRPPEDPEFFKLNAIVMEHVPVLREAHEYWQLYDKSLATVTTLSVEEQQRARAMVWLRMGDNAGLQLDLVAGHEELPFLRMTPNGPPRPLSPNFYECYRRSIALAPDWLTPRAQLVESLQQEGKPEELIAAAEDLLARFPDHLATLTLLADAHKRRGDIERAADLLERALAAKPLDRVLRHQLGHLRRRAGTLLALEGKFPQARAMFESALRTLGSEPHAVAALSWAACEFKAGNAARAEELLAEAAATEAGRAILDGWMYIQAVRLQLPKPIKTRFEQPFKTQLDAADPTPDDAVAVLRIFVMMIQEDFTYHGSKTHLKKAIGQVEKTLRAKYDERQMNQVGYALLAMRELRTLQRFARKWAREFPQSPLPPLFEMESCLTDNEDRWPIWQLAPLATKAMRLAELLPPGAERDGLLNHLQERLNRFRGMHPIVQLLDPFESGGGHDDREGYDPW